MPHITVKSDDFIKLINAAKATVYPKANDDPTLAAVYLTSATRPGAEAGQDDVLIAVSSDALVAGQTTITADGQLPEPVVVDFKANSWVATMVKNAQTAMKKLEGNNVECAVELTFDSNALRVQTITDGVRGPADNFGVVPLVNVDYPIADVMSTLRPVMHKTITTNVVDDETGVERSEELPDGPAIGFLPSQVDLMKSISTAVGEPVIQYPHGHRAGRRTLTCGDLWRGTVPGFDEVTEVNAEEPQVDLIELNEEREGFGQPVEYGSTTARDADTGEEPEPSDESDDEDTDESDEDSDRDE